MRETITKSEFHASLEAGQLVLSLVGMSGMGKSSKSDLLSVEAGFEVICCDSEIEKGLQDDLQKAGLERGIGAVAQWLGHPLDKGFVDRQKKYLDLEIATMQEIVHRFKEGPPNNNTVIDTTGSVVYTGEDIRKGLGEVSTIVYLEPTKAKKEKLLAKFLAKPKPVVWGDLYVPEVDELPEDTLARCYPALLDLRTPLYKEMSHVTIPKTRSIRDMGARAFLGTVEDLLPIAA